MIKRLLVFGTLILFISLFINVLANDDKQEALRIKRLTSQVEFDGMPFEEAWNGLDFFPMTVSQPNFGAEPSEKSEIMMAYDDEYIWIGARLFMKDASKITFKSKERDELLLYDDSFYVFFDTYNDNENGLGFQTMPTGLRADIAISSDAQTGGSYGTNSFNIDWNTFWDVKTTQDDKGWYVEMRIPFSSLKFKPREGITTMGLLFRRGISYCNEVNTFPACDPRYGAAAITKPSLAATVEFEGAKPSKPVYVSPYVIGGNTRNWVLNNDRTEYIKNDEPELNAGLDVKYNINSNLTLDLTANTDFAQVEADDQQVNLTRYSLFFPEKRMFFMERASLFNYSLGGFSNLFYSRNIGLSRGEVVRIYGGARILGRLGKWDMGLIDMQTEEHDATPGENFGVFRMRRQVINPYSYVGGIFTSRIGMNGAQNYAYGLDGNFRLFGVDYLDLKVAQTYDDKIGNKINSIDPVFLSAAWERRSVKGFAYKFGYSFTGQEFKPGIGLVIMGGMQGLTGQLLYGWVPGRESRIFTSSLSLNGTRYNRLSDGELESLSISPKFALVSKKGYHLTILLNYQKEGVLRSYSLAEGDSVLAGNYSFTNVSALWSSPSTKPFRISLNLDAGGFYDGQLYAITFKPSYNLSASLQLSGSYEFNHIIFPDRNIELNTHNAGAKVLYMFSTKLSASVFVQYVSTTADMISNFRLRYNPREGNDFYLVFNDYREITNERYTPELPNYFTRTILMKYTHTFRL